MACCIAIAGIAAAVVFLVRLVALAFGFAMRPATAWRPGKAPNADFSLSARMASFGFAWQGIAFAIRSQANMRLHLLAAAFVIAAGLAVGLPLHDWPWLVAAIGAVLATETMNTAIEQVCDLVSPDYNPIVKQAKDLAAGAVLIAAITAAVIGIVVFASAVSAEGWPVPAFICG